MAYNYNPYLYQNYQAQPFMPMPSQTALQAPQQPQQMGQGLSPSSRPVTGREEAYGTPADFNGNLMVFPDISHNRIYLKRWNMQTGSADFIEFAPVMERQEENKTPDIAFASIDDLEDLKDIVDGLKKDVEKLKKPVAGKAAKKDDE